MKVGVFIDVSNLYFCVMKKYPGRKLNYASYLQYCKDLGEVVIARAYGAQMNGEAAAFIYRLKQIGYDPKYRTPKVYKNDKGEGVIETKRKADWDVGMALELVDNYEKCDLIVLGTADGDLAPALDWVKRKNKNIKTVILASGISRDLKDTATQWVEIPESMLEQPKEKKSESKNPGTETK